MKTAQFLVVHFCLLFVSGCDPFDGSLGAMNPSGQADGAVASGGGRPDSGAAGGFTGSVDSGSGGGWSDAGTAADAGLLMSDSGSGGGSVCSGSDAGSSGGSENTDAGFIEGNVSDSGVIIASFDAGAVDSGVTVACSGIANVIDAGTVWTQHNSPGPSARSGAAMAFDSVRGRTVLFGGAFGSGTQFLFADTWEYDGLTWTQKFPIHAPVARSGSNMVFESHLGKMLLFGGTKGTSFADQLNDTWEWNGIDWIQVLSAVTPPARDRFTLSYDGAHQRVVLFGGFNPALGGFLNDTWEWSGSSWLPQFPSHSPPARASASMASRSGITILFSGQNGSIAGPFLSDTWAWNGTDWTPLCTAMPSARVDHAMQYDSDRGTIVLFGGLEDSTTNYYSTDTWEWDGISWQRIVTSTIPNPIIHQAMAYDSVHHRIVTFGGWRIDLGYSNDVWFYSR
jgi:Galactose oxidase, central domain